MSKLQKKYHEEQQSVFSSFQEEDLPKQKCDSSFSSFDSQSHSPSFYVSKSINKKNHIRNNIKRDKNYTNTINQQSQVNESQIKNQQNNKNKSNRNNQIKSQQLLEIQILQKKYEDINKIKTQIIQQNDNLRKQNQNLKIKLNSFNGLQKRYQLLSKQNTTLKIDIEKLKSKAHTSKLDIQIQDKNALLIEVQKLQQKCKDIQKQMKMELKRKDKQFQIKINQYINQEKSNNQWRDKFIHVFLDMVQKVPVDISPQWSDKKKVRIGWKAIKLMIKKSLRLGIQPPKTVIQQ